MPHYRTETSTVAKALHILGMDRMLVAAKRVSRG